LEDKLLPGKPLLSKLYFAGISTAISHKFQKTIFLTALGNGLYYTWTIYITDKYVIMVLQFKERVSIILEVMNII